MGSLGKGAIETDLGCSGGLENLPQQTRPSGGKQVRRRVLLILPAGFVTYLVVRSLNAAWLGNSALVTKRTGCDYTRRWAEKAHGE
jgi:hypothetical protein